MANIRTNIHSSILVLSKVEGINNHFGTYVPEGTSTTVEDSLQIPPFLTNKPNFKKVKLNVTSSITKEYAKMDTWSRGKNKPNSNPNKPNFALLCDKTNPIQTQYKPKQTRFQSPPLLINRISRLCHVHGSNISLDSAKMALYTNNGISKKDDRKILNLLRYKRLNIMSRLQPPIGTPFAHLILGNFYILMKRNKAKGI